MIWIQRLGKDLLAGLASSKKASEKNGCEPKGWAVSVGKERACKSFCLFISVLIT